MQIHTVSGTQPESLRLEKVYLVLRSEPRLQFSARAGTPESDPLTFMRFVYSYRDYIIQAACSTGWPESGICPRLRVVRHTLRGAGLLPQGVRS